MYLCFPDLSNKDIGASQLAWGAVYRPLLLPPPP